LATNNVRLGIVGLGTVGMDVLRTLRKNRAVVRSRCGTEVEVARVADRDVERLRACGLPPAKCSTTFQAILNDPAIEIVVELIGGAGAARELVTQALKAGKHVVTANKALLAAQWQEILSLAHRRRRALGFEASVMAGVPVIHSIEAGLAGNQIQSLFGILNGTTNFILTRMAQGLEFDSALHEARARGLCEADASLDIDGYDAAQKLAILGTISLGRRVPVAAIYREGIGQIERFDIEEARSQFDYVLRPLAVLKRGRQVEARVHPTFIPTHHPLAAIENEFNALLIHTDTAGPITLSGKGAGGKPAASGVISDIVEVARAIRKGDGEAALVPAQPAPGSVRIAPIEEVQSKFYLRFSVVDRPRILAFISGALGRHGVSIATCHQLGRSERGAVPLIMVTHLTREGAMRRALSRIDASHRIVKRKTVVVRIEE